MKRLPLGAFVLCLGAYLAGFVSHALYQRWQASPSGDSIHAVAFMPSPEPSAKNDEAPLFDARDVNKIKAMNGRPAKVRGRVYRVGHSVKSDTYFLSFGPSRAALTGVIFASAAGLFQKKRIDPKSYEGKEVEIAGEVKDHPKYGLEIVLEEPEQIRLLD